MLKEYYKRVQDRIKEVRMLHVGLGSNFWHPYDVWFVITGRM